MRIFFAGPTGVLGSELVPLLLSAGHDVAAMTRTPEKAAGLAAPGARPVICDAYDRARLTDVMTEFGPELVMHELTDLPDRLLDFPTSRAANARIRRVGPATSCTPQPPAAPPDSWRRASRGR